MRTSGGRRCKGGVCGTPTPPSCHGAGCRARERRSTRTLATLMTMPLQRFSPGRRACAMSEAFEAADGGGRISSLRSVSRAHKETVMAVIAMRRKALRLSPETPGVAEEVLQQQGWREVAEAARQLHREWLNDLFVYDEAYEAAAGRPDEAFLTWLRARARDPWHVTPRAVDDVGRRYGGETANLFQHIRWPQEIAWARVLRRSRDERTAVQA